MHRTTIDRHPERFNLRLTPDEARMLTELASAIGVSASDVVRMQIREKHAERFGTAPSKPKPARSARRK